MYIEKKNKKHKHKSEKKSKKKKHKRYSTSSCSTSESDDEYVKKKMKKRKKKSHKYKDSPDSSEKELIAPETSRNSSRDEWMSLQSIPNIIFDTYQIIIFYQYIYIIDLDKTV